MDKRCKQYRMIALLTALQIMTVSLCPAEQTNVARVIKRSDVVFTHFVEPDVYRHYGTTLVAWGFRPKIEKKIWEPSGSQLIAEWQRRVTDAHSVGARYQARVELDAGWRGMIEFDPNFRESLCIDLAGKPITYWFWPYTYKGNPPYYFCTNAPGFRRYLKYQAAEALAAKPDMLLIDSLHTTVMTAHWGGCFCRYCLAAFRDYVAKNVPREKLAKLSINNLKTFDYGAFLRSRAVTVKKFRNQVYDWPPTLPLARQYLTFQQMMARNFLADFREAAETIAGRPIALSASAPLNEARDWYAAPVVDYFTIETSFNAKTRNIPAGPIFRYKLADALDRRILSTGFPIQDWKYVRDNKLPGLVRIWIAQSYAFGHNFMVPYSMWCGAEQGERYKSKPGDCDDLYQFVRRYAELFDGYDAVAHVGLLYSNTAMRRWKQHAKDACIELAQKNVPFRFVVAGDDWLPKQLTPDDLKGLKAVIVTEPNFLDANQQAVLNAVRDRIVIWPDTKRLFELVPRQLTVEGASDVTVIPRVKPADTRPPAVCHLLNGSYQPDSDSMKPKRDFTIYISKQLFSGDIKGAMLLAPGKEPVRCRIRPVSDKFAVDIPRLDLWAILRLQLNREDVAVALKKGK